MPKVTDPSVLAGLNGAAPAAQGGVFTLPPDPLELRRDERAGNADARAAEASARAATAAERSAQNEAAGLNLRITDNKQQGAQRQFGNTRDLKKDYDGLPAVKAYEAIVPLTMQGLQSSADATGDQTLLYRYAKVMDPGSVVRESEQGAAANGSNYWDQAVASVKKQLGVEGGGALTPIVRERLKRDMLAATQQMGLSYRQIRDRYSRDASDNGIDPKYVIGPDAFDPFLKQFDQYNKRPQGAGQNAAAGRVSGVTPWQFDAPGGGGGGFAGTNDVSKGIPIPPQMQAEYEGYVKDRAGNLDPQQYAQFRNDLAQRYGFGGSPELTQTYKDEAGRLNGYAKSGQRLNLNIPPAETKMSGLDRINNAVFDNPVGGAAFGAAGGWSDELAGTASSLINGTDRGVEIAKANALRQGMSDKYPKSTLAGQLGVTAAGAYAVPNILPSAFNTTAGTLGTGAVIGGISGAGEDNDNRLRGGMFGAGLGIAGGAAGRALAAPIESLARSGVGQKVGQVVSRARGQPFNPAPQLSQLESAAYGLRPDVAQASQNLRDAGDLGLPYALADADPKMQMLAGTVTRRSPDAYALAKGTLNPRDAGQAERAIAGINGNLAPVTDIAERSGQLRQAAQIAASPEYAAGRMRAAPVDDRVQAFLNTDAGKKALNDARTLASNDGRDPNAMGFDLDDQGQVAIRNLPSWETLDYVKRGFDQQLAPYRDPFGRINLEGNPAAQSIDNLRKRFLGTLDELNPDYAAARGTYAREIGKRDALQQGQKLTSPTIQPRQLDDITRRWSPEQLAEGQRGYATSMADSVANTRLSANPYNTVYGSMGQRDKVASMFPEGADRFARQYDLEDQMRGTRQEVLGGSQTAQRLASDQAIGESALTTALDAGSQLATGGGLSLGSAIQMGRKMFGDRARLGIGKKAEERAAKMAPALFDTSDPISAANALDDLARKYGVIDDRRAAVARRLGMFGALGAPRAVSGW
jgi:hypothetical protein